MHLQPENPQVTAPPEFLTRPRSYWRLVSILSVCLALSGCGALTPAIAHNTSASGNPAPPPAVSYDVDLSWDIPNSSSDPIIGYKVYRSIAGASSYQLLNSILDADPGWDDTTVQSGAVYDYIVTSVDKSGVESGPSNAVSLTIP